MLTEIEWWGGIIFITMAFCLKIFVVESRKHEGYLASNIATYIMFLCAIVVLALYFYDLRSQVIQLVYVGCFGLGAIATLIVLFWPEKEVEKAEDDVDDSEEEEVGKAWELAGQLIFICPVLVSLALAGFKVLSFDLQALLA